jgi:hypothetical protein
MLWMIIPFDNMGELGAGLALKIEGKMLRWCRWWHDA